MAKKRTVDQILNETLPGPSKDIYKKKWDEFKVFLAYLSHNGCGCGSQQLQSAFGWKSVSTAQKYVDESGSGAQAIASVFNFTKAPTTNNTTVVSQQDGERATKIYNVSVIC